jgi:hypothetical protein
MIQGRVLPSGRSTPDGGPITLLERKGAEMRGVIVVAALCAFLTVSVGCAGYRTPVMPPVGGLFADVKAPLTSEYSGQSVQGKSGEASSASILSLIAWGDCSLTAAAADGNLSTIECCDYAFYNVLGVYQKFTVIAHGK